MSKVINLVNKKFGRLKVLCQSSFRNPKKRSTYWTCICECGKIGDYDGYYLRKGDTKSCGCLKIEISTSRLRKHGHYGTSTYSTWAAMIQRCHNPRCPAFPRYGGRGIIVCECWRKDFLNFLNDMGERPHDFSIDRIDNDKGYFPENCRWVTAKTQARNTRRHIKEGIQHGDWIIEKRIEKEGVYLAKGICIRCGRKTIRVVNNFKHQRCSCKKSLN